MTRSLNMGWYGLLLFVSALPNARADVPVFELSLSGAESRALSTSNQLKASVKDQEASQEQRDVALVGMLPRLSIQGNYQYNTTVPLISFGGPQPQPFGLNTTYSVGPVLSYTLWDTFSSWNSFHSASLQRDAQTDQLQSTRTQTLLGVRSAYLAVRLAIENLTLVQGSLDLAKAQDKDIANRFHAGAASRLDLLTSQRSVLNYQQSFARSQADLATALKGLLSLIGEDRSAEELSHPAPPGISPSSLILKFDSLQKLLSEESGAANAILDVSRQPQIQSLRLQAESLESAAASQRARAFPVIQVSAGISWMLPNGPFPPGYQGFNQNTVGVTASLPLWVGDPSWHQAARSDRQAEATSFRANQLTVDIERDYSKARVLLKSLHEQRELATRDIAQSEEAARLYYTSYKAGRNTLLDVQNANNQALIAKLTAAKLDAQIVTQLITIKALVDKEPTHD